MNQPDMFDWIPQGPTELGRFRDFSPVRVLDWYDGPRLFTIREGDVAYLVYLCLEAHNFVRYLVTPTDEECIEALTSGATTVFNAIKNPVVWVIDARGTEQRTVYRCSWSSVPHSVVPQPHVLLSRSLEPLLRIYVEGATLSPSSITASLLSKYVENSYLLLRRFFEKVDWRGGSDPPVQHFALGSLMLSYRAPGAITDKTAVDELSAEFKKKVDHQAGDPKMLQAVAKMCPFARSGPVDSVTITGLLPATSLTLVRGDRRAWNNAFEAALLNNTILSVAEEGNVEEIDGGRGTFTLRDLSSGGGEIRCRADETIIGELREAFAEGFPRIKISGTRVLGDAFVSVEHYELLSPRLTQQP